MPPELKLVLRRDLRRALAAGHPWIYRDALDRAPGSAGGSIEPGTVVRVEHERRFVARGIAEAGPIAVRAWTTKDEPLDAAFVRRRVESALALRDRVTPPETDAIRVVHGEGDRLGGVVCDRYGPDLVVQLDGEGAPVWRTEVIDALRASTRGVEGILVRTGRRGQKKIELAHGRVPEEPVEVREHGMRVLVDLWHGQKTGLFLDHRESRFKVRGLARDARVLNLYGYTGGFSLGAAMGGAREVDTVDVAEGALALARASFERNAIAIPHRTHAQDVPAFLEEARASKQTWDLIVADPPSFAPNEASKPAAMKSYRKLHGACLRLLAPGGLYLAASCSSHVGRDAFEQTIKDAAEKSSSVLAVLDRWGAPPDHPRLLAFPEGDYLKSVLCRRVG